MKERVVNRNMIINDFTKEKVGNNNVRLIICWVVILLVKDRKVICKKEILILDEIYVDRKER